MSDKEKKPTVDQPGELPGQLQLLTNFDLAKILRDLRRYQRMADEVKQEIDLRHRMIQDHMKLLGVDEMIHSGYKITWKVVKYLALNGRKLAKDHPDIYEEYSKPVEAKRFKIAAAPVDTPH